MGSIARSIKNISNALGFDIVRYPPKILQDRIKLMNHYNIDTIFDIGANKGQYGLEMRKSGYKKRIVSFEPLKSAFSELTKTIERDVDWQAENVAIGNYSGEDTINISGNSVSSSLLNMLSLVEEHAPEAKYIGKEKVDVRMLDELLPKYVTPENKLFVKIDAQGFEKQVLEGATESFRLITGLQIELSLSELYEGAPLYTEIIEFLQNKGYLMVAMEPGFSEIASGKQLQFDGFFFKS